MHRIVITGPGGYSALEYVESPDPQPGPGEVVIATEACGLNYADGIIRMGLYESAKKLHGYPITPGFEVAGRVAAVGEGVDRFRPGDEVIGLTLFDGYASHLKIGIDGVFAKPEHLTMAEAATLPTVFLTAWWMIHRQLHPRPNETWLAPTGRLMVYGFHTMLPKSGRLNWAKLAIDWLRTPRFNPLHMTRDNKSVLAANLSFLQSHAPTLREGMLWLLERFESGELQALPLETWPLRDAAGAQQRIESGQTVGKLALIS